jgi:hypothetical protein
MFEFQTCESALISGSLWTYIYRMADKWKPTVDKRTDFNRF